MLQGPDTAPPMRLIDTHTHLDFPDFDADRDALLSAVAAVGYRELGTAMLQAVPEATTVDDLATLAVAYVRFASVYRSFDDVNEFVRAINETTKRRG